MGFVIVNERERKLKEYRRSKSKLNIVLLSTLRLYSLYTHTFLSSVIIVYRIVYHTYIYVCLYIYIYIHSISQKYAHGFCFAVLCCGYTLTDFPISIRLTSLALWQSNDCPSASKATLMNMDKYFMWIHYERLHNHNKAKHNKTVCIFLGIYCIYICQCLRHVEVKRVEDVRVQTTIGYLISFNRLKV